MKKTTIKLFMLALVVVVSSFTSNKKQTGLDDKKIAIKTDDFSMYKNIKKGSFLSWRATHLGGVNPRFGKVLYENASILVKNNNIVKASILIDMSKLIVKGMSADEAKDLAEHLKSTDFFNVKKYPTSKFELTSIEGLPGKYNSKVSGNLRILGVTKNIVFKANVNVSEKEVSIKSENFLINREDWGLTYHAKGAAGVPLDYLIADNIEFVIGVVVAK